MNYDQARQRDKDKLWDYTSMNDGVIRPLGYCAGWRPLDPTDWLYVLHKPYWDRLEQFKDKFHDDGHATDVEACDCYRGYLLDHRLDFISMKPHEKCQVCGVYTGGWAQIDGWSKFCLCAEHQTRAVVESLWPAGQSTSSVHS